MEEAEALATKIGIMVWFFNFFLINIYLYKNYLLKVNGELKCLGSV